MSIPFCESAGQDAGDIEIEDTITLCIDPTKSERCWLELRGLRGIHDDSTSDEPVVVYVGAVKAKHGWSPMEPRLRPSYFVKFKLAGDFGDIGKIQQFQKAIIADWKGFSRSNIAHFAKGTTIGKSYTSASFTAKALKTGFDAVAMPAPAYSGLKMSGWSAGDLHKYAKKRKGSLAFKDRGIGGLSDISDFLELPPHPSFSGKEEPAVDKFPDKNVDYVRSIKAVGHSGNFAYGAELRDKITYERVIGYGFRGDSRSPVILKNDFQGSFLPNFTRPDHIKRHEDSKAKPGFKETDKTQHPAGIDPKTGVPEWRTAKDVEENPLNLQAYIQDEFLGGYISVTRYAMIARSFACGKGGTVGKNEGWIYACFVEGAFNVPRKGTDAWATKDEYELAMPGMLEWQDVAGWRKVDVDGNFTGPVYLRNSMRRTDPGAFKTLYKIFSGMNQ